MAVASVLFKGVLIRSTLNGRVSKYELEAFLVVIVYFLVYSLANGHFGSFVEGRICWMVIALALVTAAGTEGQPVNELIWWFCFEFRTH